MMDILSDEFRAVVEANRARDPIQIALDGRVPNAAKVASQVKYLQRAEHKLPSWFAARCIIPPLAFEQSSSEATATRKNFSGHSGRLAIDLTCGLGVDAWALSRNFEQVIAIERDSTLAAIAQENFRRLGAHNIQVINTSAEEFLSCPPAHIDLIYADPDRRSAEGRKLVRLEDCSPNIIALSPIIQQITPLLVVKLSPIFDVDEIFRIFAGKVNSELSHSVQIEVVSLDGECKEIIAQVAFSAPNGLPTIGSIRAVSINVGEPDRIFFANPDEPDHNSELQPFDPEGFHWLIVPDVALQKARLARRYFWERGVWTDSDNSYGFSIDKPIEVIGKVFEIQRIEPFDPKCLKAKKLKNIDIMKRNFPLSTAEIARQIGVKQGGETKIAFTRADGRLWQIYLVNR